MVSHWIYSLFYLSAELWSLVTLSVLFWGYVNQVTPYEEAKEFYPFCVLVGNCAGILSGQISRFLCHSMTEYISWQQTLQIIALMVIFSGAGIMAINRKLSKVDTPQKEEETNVKESVSFTESIASIFRSKPLLYIALLVVGFGLATNLIEVVWKESIKKVHSTPQSYNAYVNQLTSIIGISAVVVSFATRRFFRKFRWSQIALATPFVLFFTSLAFFLSLLFPPMHMESIASLFNTDSLVFAMTLGSIYYVFALTAKYAIFDTTKEVSYLAIGSEERMRAKAVIDSLGSRLGKSGASFIYQFLLIFSGTATGHLPFVSILCIFVIGASFLATKKLGVHVEGKEAKAFDAA
jgi:AAA family ATP:ADP antiporter